MNYTENKLVNKYIEKELNRTSKNESPIAMIIAGQPGGGKGGVEAYLKEKIDRNSITIDPDTMRDFHPDQKRLQKENDKTAANYTHEDASRWAEMLRDIAIENKRNIIIDGTLKSPDKAEALCKMLKEKGYKIEIHAIAVNELQSKLGVVARYEASKNRDGYGRWVPESVHDDAYNGVLKSLEVIEEKKLADAICVHTRDDKNIYENRLNEEGKYSQENPHVVEKIIQQRAKEFSQETKEQMKDSIDKTMYLMNKRNASQVDKNYLFDLSSAINKKNSPSLSKSRVFELARQQVLARKSNEPQKKNSVSNSIKL